MVEVAVHLNVHTDVTKKLVLRLVNSYGKYKANWILPLSKLIGDCYLTTHTVLVIFGL